MTSYVEHANVTVSNLDKAIEFLTTAIPEFGIRKRFHLGGRQGRLQRRRAHRSPHAHERVLPRRGRQRIRVHAILDAGHRCPQQVRRLIGFPIVGRISHRIGRSTRKDALHEP